MAKCKIAKINPSIFSVKGLPPGWQHKKISVENASHNCGVLVKNITTGIYMIFDGSSFCSVDQKFAKDVWKEKH